VESTGNRRENRGRFQRVRGGDRLGNAVPREVKNKEEKWGEGGGGLKLEAIENAAQR